MASPEQVESLRESIRRTILDHLTDALLDSADVSLLSNPVLRVEACIQDGNAAIGMGGPAASPVVSKMLDLSGFMTPRIQTPMQTPMPDTPVEQALVHPHHFVQHGDPTLHVPGLHAEMALRRQSIPQQIPSVHDFDAHRAGPSSLRPARAPIDMFTVQDGPDSQRQMQVPAHFPKRAKVQSDPVVFSPQQPSVDKFVVSIWDQIHGGISLDPQSLLEQWQLTANAAKASINAGSSSSNNNNSSSNNNSSNHMQVPDQLDMGLLTPPMSDVGNVDLDTFNRSNIFCRKVTQASRACRSIEVIVQARWIEHFDSHVELLATTNPSMSPTKRRKAALIEACNDFGWSEKELRNKMAIWRGYKEIKDAGGWAALVFAGMGLYRFCKYRVGFTPEAMARLRALRPRIEVAADTLHPTWRQLLMIVGESPQRRFCGHPHDWVVQHDGSDPVPLRSTYLEYDPFFSFEHLDGSVIDVNAWGPEDDPRWVPPLSAAACVTGVHTCHSCGQEQSEDPKVNSCYCFPSLFGAGRRSPSPVQVFRTPDGRNNGLVALSAFERGAAIGEFIGLITKDVQNLDVMDSTTGIRGYQIWQGRQGNFTRFVNHSCRPNAQFQHFVWLSQQRIVLVSKGIEAGHEITVDYSASYWRGLDKKCLCGEGCCRYGSSG